MRISKRKGSPFWWITWNDQNGKRHRRSSGTEDRRSAEALAAKWVKEDFLELHFDKKPEVPFSEALFRYAKVHKRDHSNSYYRSTRYRLRDLQEYFGEFNLSEITLLTVQEYMDERLVDVSLSTAQKDVSTLRAIMNKAYREDFLDKAPRFPELKTIKGRDRWLKPEEELSLVNSAATHLVPIIRFAVDTGGRLSELLKLNWEAVDMEDRSVRFIDTKNGEDRTLRLCDRAIATLARIGPKDNGSVFTFRGKSIKSVKTAFNIARKKAGLKDVRFHDLRHTFASRLVQGGVPLYEVQHLMGHKSLDMVQRYAHLAPDYQKRAVEAQNEFWHNLGTIAGHEAA